MEKIWTDLYNAAKAVQNDRKISDYISAGCVAAAIESESGKIYTGVCIDTCSTLGICAERNAIFNMITNGENAIKRVAAILPDGSSGAPCGACRELMVQLMPGKYQNVEILMDYKTGRIMTLGELTPEWWIK
ncbi:MAG: cytidine deaminase [Spirochaetales bacterium]|nr:cytidine deaminase [Spirochaetales bacterium]